MVETRIIVDCGALVAAAALPWALRGVVTAGDRPDGAPSTLLMRLSAIANLALMALLLSLAWLSTGRLVAVGQLWRHDPWSALLFGALAGLFLHVAGSGSPLPLASLRDSARARASSAGTLLFLVGAAATVGIWFGVGLPSLLHWLPRLPALFLAGAGYGLARGGSGQDHILLGAIDGLLLGLLMLLTGSLLAVLLAQVVADVWAYAGAAAEAEDRALAVEAGEPNFPGHRPEPAGDAEERVERLG
jgi:hypothetical protein